MRVILSDQLLEESIEDDADAPAAPEKQGVHLAREHHSSEKACPDCSWRTHTDLRNGALKIPAFSEAHGSYVSRERTHGGLLCLGVGYERRLLYSGRD